MFTSLGFPTYIIYPLAIAKLLGILAIWTRKSTVLKDFAYAGFFYTFILAISAHLSVGDGQFVPPLVALIVTLVSFKTQRKLFEKN